METIEILEQHNAERPAENGCPICGGPVIPLRDQVRCTRCLHSYCVSCEPSGANDDFELF
jgi:hypothetical protein